MAAIRSISEKAAASVSIGTFEQMASAKRSFTSARAV